MICFRFVGADNQNDVHCDFAVRNLLDAHQAVPILARLRPHLVLHRGAAVCIRVPLLCVPLGGHGQQFRQSNCVLVHE